MSIRAMNWAMEQATGDPRSQCLLYVIADCASPDGVAWPSVRYMAAKSQQSKATTQRRLKELEDMGAIARFPRWEDEDGKVNSEGRGRRTSDEIRCLLDRKIDQFSVSDDVESDDPPSQPDTPPSHSDTPPVAQLCDGPPSHCSDPHKNLNLEPKEDSPLPPQAGGEGQSQSELGSGPAAWAHAASWQRVETAWGDPILHQGTCRNIWEAFTDDERERFVRVIRGYLAHRLRQPKLPNRVNLQKLMRERDAWPGYEKLAGPDPALRTFITEGSVEHRALQVIARIGGWADRPTMFDDVVGARGYWRATSLRPDELAMAAFLDKPIEQWTTLERATKPFFAWSHRLQEWTGHRREIIKVPLLFPPHVDGTLSGSTDPPQSSTG